MVFPYILWILIASQNMYGSYILYGDVRFVCVLRYTMPSSIVVGILSSMLILYIINVWALCIMSHICT